MSKRLEQTEIMRYAYVAGMMMLLLYFHSKMVEFSADIVPIGPVVCRAVMYCQNVALPLGTALLSVRVLWLLLVRKQWLVLLPLLALVLIACTTAPSYPIFKGKIYLIYMCLMAAATFDIQRRLMLQVFHASFVLAVVASVAFTAVGAAVSVETVLPYAMAYSVGWFHPNILAHALLGIALLTDYLYLSRCSLALRLPLLAIYALPMWFVTANRAAVILLCCYVFCIIEMKRIDTFLSWTWHFPRLCFLFALGYTMLYHWEILPLGTDQNFSSRFMISAIAWREYGLTLFGPSSDAGLPWNFDCVFMRVILYHGLIVAFLFNAAYTLLFNRLTDERANHILLICVLVFLSGMMEHYLLIPTYSYTLLLLTADAHRTAANSPR